jgi:hypothetical protein
MSCSAASSATFLHSPFLILNAYLKINRYSCVIESCSAAWRPRQGEWSSLLRVTTLLRVTSLLVATAQRPRQGAWSAYVRVYNYIYIHIYIYILEARVA